MATNTAAPAGERPPKRCGGIIETHPELGVWDVGTLHQKKRDIKYKRGSRGKQSYICDTHNNGAHKGALLSY